MRLTRVYSRTPLETGRVVLLEGAAAEHVSRVLRLRSGATLTVFDGRGGEFEAQILSIDRPGVRITVGRHSEVERESPLALTLVQGISRGERMDLVVQKATELGVQGIVPLEAERSIVRLDMATRARRIAHWQSVAASACEQCGRNRVPTIAEPSALREALALVTDSRLKVLLDPGASRGFRSWLSEPATSLAILIGPEGGLTEAEREHARAAGFVGCNLGRRILRTETAAIAALAAVQTLTGDLGGL